MTEIIDTPGHLKRFSIAHALTRGLTDNDLRLPLVVRGGDHSFVPGMPIVTIAEYADDGQLFEYHNDENMFPGSKKVRVLLAG